MSLILRKLAQKIVVAALADPIVDSHDIQRLVNEVVKELIEVCVISALVGASTVLLVGGIVWRLSF